MDEWNTLDSDGLTLVSRKEVYEGSSPSIRVTREHYSGGTKETWYKDGVLHRDDDLPAKTTRFGTQMWYKEGALHRDGDKPAVIRADGSKEWWINGWPHRDGDKPAIIRGNGTKEWYENGRWIRTEETKQASSE